MAARTLHHLTRIVVSCLLVLYLHVTPVQAQDREIPTVAPSPIESSDIPVMPVSPAEIQAPNFARGTVLSIDQDQRNQVGGYTEIKQTVTVRLTNGEAMVAEYQLPIGAGSDRLLKVGQEVVVALVDFGEGNMQVMVSDVYRLPSVFFILGSFVVVILILSGWRGITALGGLAFSIWLLLMFVVPQIAQGANPLIISTIATIAIAVISLFVAHGINHRSVVALLSTLFTLGLALLAALSFVEFAQLFGLGSEEGIELQYGALTQINLKGLLLAGMLIGALGVLDDITTAQTAAIQELHRANPKLTVTDLYQRGMSIGREHITSLVNTLALAYAGVSLPMLLVFQVYQQPLWVTLNSEFVVEEIVRTVVGSLALAVAVPITTWLAAQWFVKWFPSVTTKELPTADYHHH